MSAGILFLLVAHTLVWFQINSQFAWPWWADRPLLSTGIFSIPISILFWHAAKNIVGVTEALWASKLIGFGVGTIIFAVLTWVFMQERVFTTKTVLSLALASTIVVIQIVWK